MFTTALKALDVHAVSPFHPSSNHSPHLLRQNSSAQRRLSHSTSANFHTSRNNSPQDAYFAPASSARYPIPPKPKMPPQAPKYSLSAPVSASDTRPQTVTQRSADSVKNILSMDVVKQSTVRFIYGQGHSKTVYISGCSNGDSIKRKALKKIGIKDLPENWTVFIADNDLGTTTRPVSDLELVTICHSQDRRERNRLMLCAAGTTPSIKQLSKSQQIFRDSTSSPVESKAPVMHSQNVDTGDYVSSFIDDYNPGTLTPSSGQHLDTLTDNSKEGIMMSNESSRKRLRKFYGQRPPSELISSNLKEYFPEVGPALLKETIRNSIMYKRMSRASRMSRVSQRSSIASAWAYQDDKNEFVPPVPSVDDLMPSNGTGSVMSQSSTSISETLDKLSSNDVTSSSVLNDIDFNVSPPTPVSAPLSSVPFSQGLPEVDQRSSSMSMLSTQLSAIELPDTTPAPPEQRDIEEEFMDAFNREQSGPSRWIKGTVIGSGSFGTVYLGMNSITGELMAVKQVELPTGNKDTEQKKLTMIDALQREMNFLREMQHENIVQYLGSNSEGNYLNIFLEYVPGGSVATMLSNYGAFEESLIRNFVRQILHGLKYLHDRSIIHRDIKGANVLVDNKGGIKISDFGISKKLEARLLTPENNRASLQGSVYWMAPEVVKQTSYTLKADIWSLGCLIIEMFTGTHPFPEFSQIQAIFKIGAFVTPTIPTEGSDEAQAFLKQTFEIDFNKRPTAQELLQQPFLKPLL